LNSLDYAPPHRAGTPQYRAALAPFEDTAPRIRRAIVPQPATRVI